MDPQPPDEDLPPPRRPLRARWVLLILLLAALGAYLAYRQTDSYALEVLSTYGIRVEITPDGVSSTDMPVLESRAFPPRPLLDRIFPWRTKREPLPIETHDLERIALLLNRLHVTSIAFYQDSLSKIETLDALAAVPEVRHLSLNQCIKLKNIKALAQLQRLETLNIGETPTLRNLDGLDSLPALQSISIFDSGIENIDTLARIPNLRELHIGEVPGLADLDVLKDHPSLTEVEFAVCQNLQDIHALGTLPKLKTLSIARCNSLRNIEPLLNAKRLDDLVLLDLPITDGKLLDQLSMQIPSLFVGDRLEKLMMQARREREAREGALKRGVDAPETGGDGLEEGERSLE